MRKTLNALLLLLVLFPLTLLAKDYKYSTVPGDPMKTRIYTLDNGLTVYLTENKETPRIQTDIAVRVGGKNDPAETTGLAHYFEHLMFKGTKSFGTSNYAKEEPLLNEIERLFEVYRKTTDPAARKALYAKIDSVSYEASKYSIPNEYDKLMSAIGANGTNAYTSYDKTVFVEDIPSNQIDNWAKIQADRFSNSVIRGFHTELETVYEEKNMSLTKDNRKVIDAMLSALFPDHPYGTQTVLGTQENLKNPSITNIKNYYKQWYVPNNIAVCMSGDFNSDEVIKTIDKYFGSMKSNYDLPKLPIIKGNPIKAPIYKDVVGKDAESMMIAWRLPGASSKESDLFDLTSSILSNGKAGLIDVNINQKQNALGAYAGVFDLADYSAFLAGASPKQGQTLEDLKTLLLDEITKLKKGEFDESLIQATINNLKLDEQKELEDNDSRATKFVDSFINGSKWEDEVNKFNRYAEITKQDIIDFANKFLADNYAVIYKRQGTDNNIKKIDKPTITPILMNRDVQSDFLQEVASSDVKPIEPVFLDFNKDITKLTAKSKIPVLYVPNTTNDLYSLTYVFDMGTNNDKRLGNAISYLKYLGTSNKSLQQINEEFYALASDFNVYSSSERVYVTLEGLKENMPKAVALFESILADAKVDKDAYKEYASMVIKKRNDSKLNQQQNFSRLMQYGVYGAKSPVTNVSSNDEIVNANPQDLVDMIHNLNSYEHKILYYGPESAKNVVAIINKYHKAPKKLKAVPAATKFEQQLTPVTKIYIAPYEANQIYLSSISNRGEKYDKSIAPVVTLYNEYFGGGMNAIVFQEMRESRALAYTAVASLNTPAKLDRTYYYMTYIATQNDKMIDAINAFDDIINNMPESETAFELAKNSIVSRISSERINKELILWDYLAEQKLGSNIDSRKAIFENVGKLTLPQVREFQEKWVKNRKYNICILGDEKSLDMKSLEKKGEIIHLTREDIFGY